MTPLRRHFLLAVLLVLVASTGVGGIEPSAFALQEDFEPFSTGAAIVGEKPDRLWYDYTGQIGCPFASSRPGIIGPGLDGSNRAFRVEIGSNSNGGIPTCHGHFVFTNPVELEDIWVTMRLGHSGATSNRQATHAFAVQIQDESGTRWAGVRATHSNAGSGVVCVHSSGSPPPARIGTSWATCEGGSAFQASTYTIGSSVVLRFRIHLDFVGEEVTVEDLGTGGTASKFMTVNPGVAVIAARGILHGSGGGFGSSAGHTTDFDDLVFDGEALQPKPGEPLFGDDGILYGGSKQTMAELLQITEQALDISYGVLWMLVFAGAGYVGFRMTGAAAGAVAGLVWNIAWGLFPVWIIFFLLVLGVAAFLAMRRRR